MAKKLTTEEFISKAKIIHGNEYDYSLSEYINTIKKVKIICHKHGEFNQAPINHLSGAGCPKCGLEKISKNKSKGLEKFLMEAKMVHHNLYDYSKVVYVNAKTNIEIICPLHGTFWQAPCVHIRKSGCPKCALIQMSKKKIYKSQKVFVARAKKIHGDTFDYSKSVYIKSNLNIIIICTSHGEFLQTPASHLQGSGCPKCMYEKISIKNQFTLQEFLDKAKKIHEEKYDYSNVNYQGSFSPIIILCKKHGPFLQKAINHLKGHGCPRCAKIISKPEIKWLDSLNIPNNLRQTRITIGNRQIKTDAYDPMTNTIYEFYGDFWHGNPKIFDQQQINDANHKTFGELYSKTIERENFIRNNGYKLITMWEYDWKQSLY